MKTSFAILALLGLVSVDAVQIHSSVEVDKKHNMVTIDLQKTEYTPNRLVQIEQAPVDDEFFQDYHNQVNLIQKSSQSNKTISLFQKKMDQIQNQKTFGTPMSIDLDNLKNMGYEGKFWFGQPAQEMQVIFDTGSALAWVFSEKCDEKKCPIKNGRYHQSQSSSFVENEKAGQALQYGKGKVLGHPAKDQICFSSDQSHCIKDMSFLTVVNSADLSALRGSGLVGLAPTPPHKEELDDPLQHGVPGFIAQLKNSKTYKDDLMSAFSIYLSNDEKSPGKMTFGGFNLDLAQKGKTEKDIFWADQSVNEQYWAVNGKSASFGQVPLANYNQQLILDNGMSLAMVPKKSFLALVETLLKDHGVECRQARPLWGCHVDEAKFQQLPSIKFDMLQDEKGNSKVFEMPVQSYMKQQGSDLAMLLLTPWDFAGMGGKKGEEYWVLGAQFLQNYYTIYDFDKKKIGLVESMTAKGLSDSK